MEEFLQCLKGVLLKAKRLFYGRNLRFGSGKQSGAVKAIGCVGEPVGEIILPSRQRTGGESFPGGKVGGALDNKSKWGIAAGAEGEPIRCHQSRVV